ETTITQHGLPDDGTDATGFVNVEIFAPLTDEETSPAGLTKERRGADMLKTRQEHYPGVELNFSQDIQDKVDDAAGGVEGGHDGDERR
ncbi:hypothetical protein, partial [Burkholderia cenocepacia]|uniref:hypothetical protein n=1 Tax=Burkholderia cenocepacia TaxID=95486 RepID=UPI00406C2B03